jgi:hypothetical protein
MPRNVQKDPEASLAWTIKDELLRRGRIHLWQVAREWSLAESRFQDELETMVSREEALKEIARVYLKGAGMILWGEPSSKCRLMINEFAGDD